MRLLAPTVALLVASTLLAGCLGDGNGVKRAGGSYEDGEGLPETSEEAEFSATEGAVAGFVIDDAVNPVPGATVALLDLGRETTTALDGSYTLSLVPPGDHDLAAQLTGYEPAAARVTVVAGEVEKVNLVLSPLPEQEPYNEFLEFKAFLECGTGFALTQKPEVEALRGPANQAADTAEPLPLLGFDGFVDRWVRLLPEEWNETQGIGLLANTCAIATIGLNITDQIAGTDLERSASNDKFLFIWSHEDPTLREVVLEMDWGSTGISGREYQLVVEPLVPETERADGEGEDEDEYFGYYNFGYEFARARGTPPLRTTIDLEDLARITRYFNENETVEGASPGETSTGNPVVRPQNFTERATFVIRIFGTANQLGPGQPADYALSFQQPIDLFITQFFGQPAPADYTGIPNE